MPGIKHKKLYGVYVYDSFDCESVLVFQTNSLETAKEYLNEKYPVNINGADYADIVDLYGRIIVSNSIG